MFARAPRSCPSSTRTLGLALVSLLGGCDKLPFSGDDTKPADAEADAARHAEDIEAARKAAVEEYKKQVEPEIEARVAAAAQKAVDDYKRELAGEVATKEVVTKEADRPLTLSNFKVKSQASAFGPSTGAMELRADGLIKEVVGTSTYVHVKAFCEDDGRIMTDIGYLNADYSKQLDAYKPGETAEVNGTIFAQGLDHEMHPCQFAFKLGGMGGGGLSVDLGQGCWDGKAATLGACAKPVVPVAASGAATPLEVLSIATQPGRTYGTGLNLNFELLFHTKHQNNSRITLKAACHEGGKSFVEVAQAYVNTGPFKLEPGESIARSASIFYSGAFGFTAPPGLCDLTASYWTLRKGSYSEYDETVLQESCLRGTVVDKGRCDGGSVVRSAPVAMTAANTALEDVKLSLITPYGSTTEVHLDIQADVTLSATLRNDQGVSGTATCKVGAEKRVETVYLYGQDLSYLLPGETTKMTTSAFSGNALLKPKWCQVEFKGGERYGSPTGKLDLGTFCLKKEKLKKGKC
ncbi:MAG: hypothetical protein AAF721_11965 [Myxococcota bacterium]